MIFFRCDAGAKYGLGHIMRCVSLAQGFQRAGFEENIFLSRKLETGDFYQELLSKNGFRHLFLSDNAKGLQFEFEKYLHPDKTNIMIFDNYDVTAEQMVSYKQRYNNLIAIDDLADREFSVDLIINQNINSERFVYNTSGPVKLLLGTSYVLMRNVILQSKTLQRNKEGSNKPRIFMSFGGGDTYSRIKRVLGIFYKLDQKLDAKISIDFAVPNNPDIIFQIRKQLSRLKRIKVSMIIGKYNLASFMVVADFALTAAGTSVFELAFLGIPQLVFMIDKNQEITGQKVNETGIGICPGYIWDVSEKEFVEIFLEYLENKVMKENMSGRGREFIDGKGTDRVVQEIIKLYSLAA